MANAFAISQATQLRDEVRGAMLGGIIPVVWDEMFFYLFRTNIVPEMYMEGTMPYGSVVAMP